MTMKSKSNTIGNSLKWSSAGELLSKLIAPITTMVLARILAPEDFGILATVNMIITFVDLFTDSGFAKYIIQCDYDNQEEFDKYVNVAFWTNFALSVFLWIMIIIFRSNIAKLVGNEGHELVIAIASTQLIITSFSSIQTALYRRFFDFKGLFIARVIMSMIPLIITIPLSFLIRNYWALVIGAIIQQLAYAIYLSLKSKWKPRFYYSTVKLIKMLSFSFWSLMEAIAYWVSTWFDVFIIGAFFSAYYLGIYKNSLSMVNSLMLLVKASVIPVLFSSLSRLKNKQDKFVHLYDSLQEVGAIILVPLGVGLFLFRDVATYILFGEKWIESAIIIGVWGIASSLSTIFVSFYGEALKAKGKPKVLFVYEIACLAVMIPICILIRKLGFWSFVYARAGVVLVQVIFGFFFMKKYILYPVHHMFKNIFSALTCSCIMAGIAIGLKYLLPKSIIFQIIIIALCIVVYFLALRFLFKEKVHEVVSVFTGKNEIIRDEEY